jgi:N-acetylglucosaminyldiphosphoundecaprenol N-acetyl-beta-D-mannosaminyltransferase
MNNTILGSRVDPTSYAGAVESVIDWARAAQSRYVCIANAHVLMEAHDSAQYRDIINGADLVTPDGMPLVWILRLKGHQIHDRVYGPKLMRYLLVEAASARLPVGLYGSTPEILALLLSRLMAQSAEQSIAYSCSPPFRDLTPAEDDSVCTEINASGARILFVGLGCPKQERWMAAHRGRINAVMLGVGAAFDFLSGTNPQAPGWMQMAGLEWLFRLSHEPRRLWRRYLVQNPRFAALVLAELLGLRRA